MSAGTELAILSGNEGWAPLPTVPGYGSIGIVREVGKRVTKFKPGDRVYSYGKHQSVRITKPGDLRIFDRVNSAADLILHVPDYLDPKLAVFARMAQVAFTAPRTLHAELGDTVAVLGLGLVGNLAAQLLTLSGCTVIGIDLFQKRLDVARSCGIAYAVSAAETDPEGVVKEITKGRMCEAVVEATGVPNVALTAARLAGNLGEVLLLGSPRGEFTADGTALLNSIHLWGKCNTFLGGHEWRYPLYQDTGGYVKHSMERNLKQMFEFTRDGKLHIKELLTHCLPPTKCREVYTNLRDRNEDYLGVVFDWTRIEG